MGKGEAVKVIDCHTDVIYCMSFNRDGSLLATTSKDKKLRVIEPRRGIVLSVSIWFILNFSAFSKKKKGKGDLLFTFHIFRFLNVRCHSFCGPLSPLYFFYSSFYLFWRISLRVPGRHTKLKRSVIFVSLIADPDLWKLQCREWRGRMYSLYLFQIFVP